MTFNRSRFPREENMDPLEARGSRLRTGMAGSSILEDLPWFRGENRAARQGSAVPPQRPLGRLTQMRLPLHSARFSL